MIIEGDYVTTESLIPLDSNILGLLSISGWLEAVEIKSFCRVDVKWEADHHVALAAGCEVTVLGDFPAI